MGGTGTVFVVGRHAYKINRSPTEGYSVWYSLYHANGWKGKPRAGQPNAHDWKRSRVIFTDPREAHAYAKHLLRDQDKEND